MCECMENFRESCKIKNDNTRAIWRPIHIIKPCQIYSHDQDPLWRGYSFVWMIPAPNKHGGHQFPHICARALTCWFSLKLNNKLVYASLGQNFGSQLNDREHNLKKNTPKLCFNKNNTCSFLYQGTLSSNSDLHLQIHAIHTCHEKQIMCPLHVTKLEGTK
jgi:hypothetical protein